jgi:hypothetical protein
VKLPLDHFDDGSPPTTWLLRVKYN